jgi:ABC-type uncharacterized transport system substrate-binding protein
MTLATCAWNSGAPVATAAEPASIVVLSGSGVPAYRAAIEGILAGLGDRAGEQVQVFELDSGNDAATLQRLRSAPPGALISVGLRAAAASASVGVPYVATMLLEEEAEQVAASGALLASVTLDVTPRAALTHIRRAFPAWSRVAVVHGPSQAGSLMQEINAQAAALGISILPLACDGPKSLLAALPKVRERVDVVWCLPNRALYDVPAVQALILSSIRFRLPLIGFSEPFLRAGALFGLVPDYRDVGRQSAELLAQRRSGGPAPARQSARKIRAMVNERVARVLGINLSGLPREVERIR